MECGLCPPHPPASLPSPCSALLNSSYFRVFNSTRTIFLPAHIPSSPCYLLIPWSQHLHHFFRESLPHSSMEAQMVKNLPAMQETQVQLLVRKMPWRRKQLPTPVFLPGQRRLSGPWGPKELDTTEQLTLSLLSLPPLPRLGFSSHELISTVYFSLEAFTTRQSLPLLL